MDTTARDRIVITGNGQAGVQLADSLRAAGFTGDITLVGDEAAFPYQRPPLSKDYLAVRDGGAAPAPLPLRGEKFFADARLDCRTGVAVTGIDRNGHTVNLSDGSVLAYTKLVLATGAANREPAVPGAGLAGIHGLRTLADAEAVHRRLDTVRNAVVIGAGFIGLEFAAAARARGIAVTVLEYADRPMARALSRPTSEWFAAAHRQMGTALRLGEGIASFTGDGAGQVAAAVSTAGHTYPADLVLAGIGVTPRTELAEAAGLAVDNGIAVDASLQTSDPDIYALGDCASYPQAHAGARLRLESVQNATDQARHLAGTLTGTVPAGPYAELPWFWSTQGALKLQIAGLSAPGDQTVLRGDPRTGRFSVFCYRDGALAAVESVNQPADHMAARRLLAAGRTLTPGQAADPDFDLKAYAKRVPTSLGT
ncbi:FAD-dependent oxidoreductase [Arthrobacter sp. I2-34]|uniref:FAD-dependent oxidoreductase n=1 Tax=Arthrobacter hankyongi TaxID=2904801 RepID=A0ABS9L211_9MICC|nr:FAD-dependent oxidoreductase [Arthrobacter hankyongi]MCG2620668.1 FAD-dependent oxidoreductase [Arthrobacter hankyongi]